MEAVSIVVCSTCSGAGFVSEPPFTSGPDVVPCPACAPLDAAATWRRVEDMKKKKTLGDQLGSGIEKWKKNHPRIVFNAEDGIENFLNAERIAETVPFPPMWSAEDRAMLGPWLSHFVGIRIVDLAWAAAPAILVCESPIERVMLLALHLVAVRSHAVVITAPGIRGVGRMRLEEEGRKGLSMSVVTINLQAPIGKYRADFHVEFQSETAVGVLSSALIVECDGHDFHERTKEQAARDRSRDRTLQGMFKVFRFTGSEIWADPMACAAQAISQLERDVSHAAARERERG